MYIGQILIPFPEKKERHGGCVPGVFGLIFLAVTVGWVGKGVGKGDMCSFGDMLSWRCLGGRRHVKQSP